MGTPIKDDWHKPRGRGEHLTNLEIAQLRSWFNCGEKARVSARKLQCSTRTVEKYFAQFRGTISWPSAIKRKPLNKKPKSQLGDNWYFESSREKPPFDPVKAREARFYKGNFEL